MSRRRAWGEDSTVALKLSGGAFVELTFKGNLFDLTPDERRLVSDLSSTVQKFKNEQSVAVVKTSLAAD
jgi:hypothetical protein